MLKSAISQFPEIVLALKDYLTSDEIEALKIRIMDLLENASFPLPNPDWPSIPWPAF
jgi:hypothetical protein